MQPPIIAIICRLFFHISLLQTSSPIIHCMGSFLLVRAVDKTNATGSEVLLQVVYYEVRCWYNSQANQVGYEKRGGTINYIVQLRSYGFDQVIFIVWIKFFLFEKHFSLLSLIATWLYLDTFIDVGKCVFQQSRADDMHNFDIFFPFRPIFG